MLMGKGAAAVLTGSTAIFSDALESVVHLGATAVAAFSLWYAARPPDAEHPYGHGKIAYVSAGVEGAFILSAAGLIGWRAVEVLITGPELQRLGIGLWITGGLAVVNGVLGWGLLRAGRRTHSLVLVANGKHVLTDMWTSAGVVVGVALVAATGIEWLDPVVALVVGANILWTGGRLLRESYQGLMETADEMETERVIETLEAACSEGLIEGFHHVRHRRVNDQVWVEQHLLLPDDLSLVEAHRRATAVETRQRALFKETRVMFTSHLEPLSHEHPDVLRRSGIRDALA